MRVSARVHQFPPPHTRGGPGLRRTSSATPEPDAALSSMQSNDAGAQVITLRADTYVQPTTEPAPCDGSYLCDCPACLEIKARRQAMGVRKRKPGPLTPRAPRYQRAA